MKAGDLFRRIFLPETLSAKIWRSAFTIVLVLVLLILIVINLRVTAEVEKNISDQLLKTNIALRELDDNRKEQIFSKTEFFIARGFFRSLLNEAAAGNSRNLLKAFQEVTGYEFLRVIRFDGVVIADSEDRKNERKVVGENMESILNEARESGRALAVIREKNRLVQAVAIVLSGKLINSVLIAGKYIDNNFAYKIDELTRNKVTFFIGDRVIATAFQKENVAEIERQLPAVRSFYANMKPENSEESDVVEPGAEKKKAEGSSETSLKTTSITIAGEDYLVYSDTLGDNNTGSFFVAASKSKQLKFLNQMQLLIVVIGVLSLVAAVFLSMFISRTITRNVNKLVSDVNVVKSGNLSHQIIIHSRDEIGFLADQFDSLREAFRESQAQLRDYADNLEEKVRERTAELTLAKRETDQIMNTVDQGLFLLYKQDNGDFTIGSQYSAALSRIVEQKEIGNSSLFTLLKNFAGDKILDNAKKYLSLMFQKTNNEKMLSKLNPLRELEADFGSEEKNKNLRFQFSRIFKNEDIAHLMGTITDATQEVQLSRKLKATEEENRRQMEMLFAILQTEPAVLSDFIADVEEDLELINETLRGQGKGRDTDRASLLERLDVIFRSMHTIKGNASLLNLMSIATRAHEFEDQVTILLEKPDLAPGDFLALVLRLNKFHETMKEVKSLISKLASFQSKVSDGKTNMTIRSLERTIETLSKEMGKEIKFNHTQFRVGDLPRKHKKLIKDIIVQLVRNSLIHGIEPSEVRKQNGKPAAGTIELTATVEKDNLKITYRDDGQGIKIDKLREKALQSGKYKPEEVAKWDASRVAQLIYESGISTAEKTSMNAGRGVGMDIIRDKVVNNGGSLGLSFKTGQFCQFQISLPLKS